jgi:hypothetical protein
MRASEAGNYGYSTLTDQGYPFKVEQVAYRSAEAAADQGTQIGSGVSGQASKIPHSAVRTEADRGRRPCKVMWRTAKEIGVTFG